MRKYKKIRSEPLGRPQPPPDGCSARGSAQIIPAMLPPLPNATDQAFATGGPRPLPAASSILS
jgi:hypothetical protein